MLICHDFTKHCYCIFMEFSAAIESELYINSEKDSNTFPQPISTLSASVVVAAFCLWNNKLLRRYIEQSL